MTARQLAFDLPARPALGQDERERELFAATLFAGASAHSRSPAPL